MHAVAQASPTYYYALLIQVTSITASILRFLLLLIRCVCFVPVFRFFRYFLLPDCPPWPTQLLHMCSLLGYPILQSASTLTTTPLPLRHTPRQENTCTTYFQARISRCLSQKIPKRRTDPFTQSHPTVRANDMSWKSGSPRFEPQRTPSTDDH